MQALRIFERNVIKAHSQALSFLGYILKMELDKLLWKDQPHITIRKLWEYLCTYIYLPRLANEGVLLNAIVGGLHSIDYFAYADLVDEDGRYSGLVFGKGRGNLGGDGRCVLVKPQEALAQIEKERMEREKALGVTKTEGKTSGTTIIETSKGKEKESEEILQPKKMRRFYGTINLDPIRAGKDASSIAESVIQHLALEKDAKVTVTIEVEADIPEGAQDNTIRTVSENCKVLKFKQFGFEEK